MKTCSITVLLIIIFISNLFSQTNNQSNTSMKYENVKTDTVTVNGTIFHYRRLGMNNAGIPVIYLNHLAATMDNCDPRIMDGIATEHQIICFDNKGVGATNGKTQNTIQEMATDARAFIHALGYDKVILFGFSMGGMIAQEILEQEPTLVDKLILTGTGPRASVGLDKIKRITFGDMFRAYVTFRDPKFYLFFTTTKNGKLSAKEFLNRLKERTENRDVKIKTSSFFTQLSAIKAWALDTPSDLSKYKQPVLVANGDNDRMVPTTPNTYDLAKRFQNSEIVIYPDAGHGGIFQNHEAFVKQALTFLAK